MRGSSFSIRLQAVQRRWLHLVVSIGRYWPMSKTREYSNWLASASPGRWEMVSPDNFDNSFDPSTKVFQVYLVLKDQQWHCRECEYTHTGITQIAGGAGIQGLQRGTQSRQGMQIESSNQFCVRCERMTRHDRWQGGFQSSVQGPSMPASFARKVAGVLGARDIIEGTERPLNQLTVDHKFPMLRWSSEMSSVQTNYADMGR